MINKIIFLFLLSFVFISCGDIDTSNTAIAMKITPLSTFSGLTSFKITAKSDKNEKIYETCKNYAETKEVGFDLDESGDYLFEFSGYTTANCSGEYAWTGSSKASININTTNNVKIAVSKLNSFVYSSINMHQGVAFMDATMLNDDIIISGGASHTNKILKRINELQCDESSADDTNKCSHKTLEDNWVCNTNSNGDFTSCYDVISQKECTDDQGGEESKCISCLQVENHKFISPNSKCYVKTCLINKLGYGCSLKANAFLQKIDTNNLSSGFLRDKNNKFLKLSETRIIHDSLSYNDKDVYFIGGASEATISNIAPFIFPKKTGSRTNLIDVYNEGIISNFSLNADFGNDILIDFNIFKTDSKFFVLNGRKDEFFNDNSHFNKVIECNTDTKNCKLLENNNTIPRIGAGIIETINNGGNFTSYIIGGIFGAVNSYRINYQDSNFRVLNQSGDTLTFGNLYKPKVFYNDGKVYVVGGLKYGKTNGKIAFGGFNNEIYVYEDGSQVDSNVYDIGDGVFSNTIFSQVLPYTYKGNPGILFVGGLKRGDDGSFDAINNVEFLSFDDILHHRSFINLPALNKARFGHSVVIDKKNKIWVMGGLTNLKDGNVIVKGNFLVDKTIEVYTPKVEEAD